MCIVPEKYLFYMLFGVGENLFTAFGEYEIYDVLVITLLWNGVNGDVASLVFGAGLLPVWYLNNAGSKKKSRAA